MRTLLLSLPFPFSRRAAIGLTLAASLSACSTQQPLTTQTADTATGVKTTGLSGSEKVLWFLSPYRIDIQQGNFVSQEMMTQLKEGMTQDQVRFLLGTPLLTDVFHANRWDYVFRLKKGSGELITSRVTVFFKEGRLANFEGGDLPNEKDYIDRIAGSHLTSGTLSTYTGPSKPEPK